MRNDRPSTTTRHVPTEADARIGLRDHVAMKAADARCKHGPEIDADAVLRMLDNRTVVRYPVGIRFDAGPLEAGEFAWPMPLGEHPKQGFCLFIHPCFEARPEVWPLLILYHVPSINYGEIVSHVEAEVFGSTVLGLDANAYYATLCELADAMPGAASDGAT